MNVLGHVADFAAELRRRHVTRVTVVYCAVGWAVAQVSTTVFPALGIPSWGVSLVTMLLLLGLPVAVVLAWAFDLTPTGVRRATNAPRSARIDPTSGPAVLALPFIDRSVAADHGYLGEGIAEELISALARLPGIRVVSRTSAFALRTDARDLREVGERYGVTHVVEGSVGVADDRVRLVVQLIAARDGYAIWSRTFERRLEDVFALQEELARAVAASLQPALAPSVTPIPAQQPRHPTRDFRAYVLYLRGRQQLNERTASALRQALELFSAAARQDPTFAQAHAGMADCWGILVEYGLVDPAHALPQARTAAAEAVRLCPDAAESRSSQALVLQLAWRWQQAEAAFRAALDVNPSYSTARQRLGLLLAWRGRFDEARQEIDRGLQADPLSPVIAASHVWVEYLARSGSAVERARAMLQEHAPGHAIRLPLALALTHAGRPEEGLAELDRLMQAGAAAAPDGVDDVALLGVRAFIAGAAGRTTEAAHMSARLDVVATTRFVSHYTRAQARMGCRDHAAALDLLQQAVAVQAPEMVRLVTDPVFDPLRGDHHFRQIIRRIQQGA